MLLLRVEALPGEQVDKAINELLRLRDALGVLVLCSFNGVELVAYASSTASSLYTEYRIGMENQSAKWQGQQQDKP